MALIGGFLTIARLHTLLLMIVGTFGGLIVGALPGLSAFTALAVMLPFTYGMSSIDGICFLVAVYVGGSSGGLISAVLLGIPGTPSSIATCFDGYPMAQKGKARTALSAAILSSFVGGIFGAVVLSFLGPYIAKVALKLSSFDYFGIILLALCTVSSLAGDNLVKGLMACLLGICLSCVGTDGLSSVYRYTFGITKLANGFSLIPVLIGLFAVSQIMGNARDKDDIKALDFSGTDANSSERFTFRQYFQRIKMIIPVSLMGLLVGILPGLGGNISNLMAYSYAKNTSKDPDSFGKGQVDGVIAAETANNATVGGAMIILLTLGIPGDNATSVILAGFQMHDIAPGPLLFKTQGQLVYAILAGFILANVLFFVMEYFGLSIFIKMLSIPSMLLLPVVIVCCFVGSYCGNNNTLDILIMVIFGLIGYLLKINDYPLAPMIVGFILAPMLELYLRRSLMKTDGAWLPILSSPIAAICLAGALLTIILTVLSQIKKAKKAAA